MPGTMQSALVHYLTWVSEQPRKLLSYRKVNFLSKVVQLVDGKAYVKLGKFDSRALVLDQECLVPTP